MIVWWVKSNEEMYIDVLFQAIFTVECESGCSVVSISACVASGHHGELSRMRYNSACYFLILEKVCSGVT